MRKQKKRNRKMLISCLLTGSILLSALPGQVVSAGEKTVTKSKTYTADNKNQTYDFPKSITKNGKKYLLRVTKYDVLSEKPVKKEKEVQISRKSNVKAKGKKADFPKQIKKDGITYVLQNVDQKDVEYKKAYTQSVTGYTDYDHQVSSSQVPAIKTITVKNAATGKMEKVQCKLSGITKTSKSGWQNTHINITFKNYDADVYEWQGKQIKKNTTNPLKGYESELLKSVGASKSDHRVLRSYWVGKPYTKNGMTYRNARADVQRMIIDESHRWLNAKKRHALELITIYLREARKFFGGIMLASQSIRDYVPEGSADEAIDDLKKIFELTQYKFIFHQDSNTLPLLDRIFESTLTRSQRNKIPKLEVGENILCIASDKNLEFRVHLTKEEEKLFNGGV